MEAWIDLQQPSLYLTIGCIIFNPLFWTIVARQEYYHQTISKLFGGNRLYGCYLLAAAIFSLGIFRDVVFKHALEHQPKFPVLAYGEVQLLGATLVAAGSILVVSSMYALGLTGTYLGDYFGILMDERVTGFPFNVTDNPMYYGSTLAFLGTSIMAQSPAGIVITGIVLIAYLIALRFEEPFTAMIYAQRDQLDAKKKKQ